jgi:phosphoglycerate dehydrogenase-like enzyme
VTSILNHQEFASVHRVHILHPPEGEADRALASELGDSIELSRGPDVADDSATLVGGVPTETQLDASARLTSLVIPWAGLPKSTAERLRARPHLRAYNLHHNAAATSEMAIALLLAAAKRIVPADRALREHDWGTRLTQDQAVSVAGRRALIIGFGAIGQRVARACEGLGMRVVAISRRGRTRHGDPRVHGPDALADQLPRADAVIVAVPVTGETEGLLGPDEFARLPAHAIVVNVSRGTVLDEKALYDALREDRLFGAGIDVWYRYPRKEEEYPHHPPSDYPFHELANVVMSPHRAGHVVDTEPLRMRALARVLNALAGTTNDDGIEPVDLDAGY